MTINSDGQFVEETIELILDAMVADFEAATGDELPPSQAAVVRTLYEPVAERLAEAQNDLGLVLSSTQIEFASEGSLGLLTSLIGVARRSATTAIGDVTFSRATSADQNYTVPKGTKVTTDSGLDAVEFKTTESVSLPAGSTSVSAPIEAVEAGENGNVSANTIVRMPTSPVGIESVTNPLPTDGGAERENDDELRERAQTELAQGSSATANALLSACSAIPASKSVSIFINDSNTDVTGGLPAHSFELVVEGATDQAVADAIMNTKAAGDTSWYGVNGTTASASVTLINGQIFDIYFSRPNPLTIYVEADVTTNSNYAGDTEVQDAIVEYIGGVRTTGNTSDGELRVGDDVVYNQILSAVMEVPGVDDVASLKVDTVTPPAGITNIAVADTDVATTDATAGNITVL